MAIIRSLGALQNVGPLARSSPVTNGSIGGPWFSSSYIQLYEQQPNVRTVVDFLARNVAQLGIKAYRRKGDTDRERLANHEVIQWLTHPNRATTRYRLFESTMIDMGIFLNAFWIKVRGPNAIGLVRVPPEQIEVVGDLFPELYVWNKLNGRQFEFAPSEIVHFGGHNPSDPKTGLAPLETLRRLLIESASATDYRAYFWRNAARHEGVIERPKDAPKWLPQQRQDFRESWQAAHAGRGNTGKTAILEDGMTWKDRSFSAKDSEFIASRKLTAEEVARAYHVPLPMVGILDHATFSNIREQHKQLYADTLGPWLEMLSEELERQLLIESEDGADQGVYLEFNIAEKLQGSFEEQSDSLMKLTGRPIMTANEARSRINLPRIEDETADELAQPLNQSTASQQGDGQGDGADDSNALGLEEGTPAAAAVARHRIRLAAKLDKVDPEERPAAFQLTRWNRELAQDLRAAGASDTRARWIAETVNREILEELLLAAEAEALEARTRA